MKTQILILLTLIGAFTAGCGRNPVYEYTDEEYVCELLQSGEDACLKKLDTPYDDQRSIAIRTICRLTQQAMRAGKMVEATRWHQILLAHFQKEHTPELKAFMLEVAFVEAGFTSPQLCALLREQMSEGAYLVEAMHAAAALRIPDVATYLTPFLEHPRYPIRVEAAMALLSLRDAATTPVLKAFIQSMQGVDWPARINGVPLPELRQTLEARLVALQPATPVTPKRKIPSLIPVAPKAETLQP